MRKFPRRLAGVALILGVLYVWQLPASDPGAVICAGILAGALGVWLLVS